jgi:AcrR family transcriptional regulator
MILIIIKRYCQSLMMMYIIVVGVAVRRLIVRITENQAEKNRQRVVAKASKLFREGGFDGISVNDLMKAAGFTHGGFYNHFESKDALASEALDHAFRQMDGVREECQLWMNSLRHICRRRPGTRPARHARPLLWQARSRDSRMTSKGFLPRVLSE